MGQVKQSIAPIGWGVVGFAGTGILPGVASRFIPLPDRTTSPVMAAAVKAGAAVGTGWLVGMFAGRKAGQAALIGGGIAVAADLILPLVAPALGLSAYLDDESGVSAYLDESGAIGYLSPGMNVDDNDSMSGDAAGVPERLRPESRF